MNNIFFVSDEQPKVEFVNEYAILLEKPEPEVIENGA